MNEIVKIMPPPAENVGFIMWNFDTFIGLAAAKL